MALSNGSVNALLDGFVDRDDSDRSFLSDGSVARLRALKPLRPEASVRSRASACSDAATSPRLHQVHKTSTSCGSKWVPAHLISSSRAAPELLAMLWGRSLVIAS